jgi:hypothetical protein
MFSPPTLGLLYNFTKRVLKAMYPTLQKLGVNRLQWLFTKPEELSKKALFDCRMCGQCVLHSTGMRCPMNCPKNLRNGPCGGVRTNGHCEVLPEMRCVWVEAYERSLTLPEFGAEMLNIQPPVNRRLEGTSAWVNMLTGVDRQTPAGWIPLDTIQLAPQLPQHWQNQKQ